MALQRTRHSIYSNLDEREDDTNQSSLRDQQIGIGIASLDSEFL